jgi:hypothetical protein
MRLARLRQVFFILLAGLLAVVLPGLAIDRQGVGAAEVAPTAGRLACSGRNCRFAPPSVAASKHFRRPVGRAGPWPSSWGEKVEGLECDSPGWLGVASFTLEHWRRQVEKGRCRECDTEGYLWDGLCWKCRHRQGVEGVARWMNELREQGAEKMRSWRDPALRRQLIEKLETLQRQWREEGRGNRAAERENNRRLLEELGRLPVNAEGRTLNDLARETVETAFPSFQGTEIAHDPIKVISYYLVVDPTGFVREVRIWRGPMGEPLTLLEAYEYYRGVDPKRAEDMLEMLEDLRKISDPTNQDPLPDILDGVIRNLRILTPASSPESLPPK